MQKGAFVVTGSVDTNYTNEQPSTNKYSIVDISRKNKLVPAELKRCSKCVLPETMPFIEFDEEGVCNWCQNETLTP